jgi:ParB family chromosome partitioning protein
VRTVEQAVKGELGAADGGAEEAADDRSTPGATIDGAGLTPSTRLRPPGLLELEQLLADHLDTRVSVNMGARRGRVTIDFADLEDLERIYRQMTGS